MGLGGQIKAKRLHYRKGGFQGRVAVPAEGAVKLLAGKPGLSSYLRHPLRTSDDAKRVCDVTGVARLESLCHEACHCLISSQILGGIVGC